MLAKEDLRRVLRGRPREGRRLARAVTLRVEQDIFKQALKKDAFRNNRFLTHAFLQASPSFFLLFFFVSVLLDWILVAMLPSCCPVYQYIATSTEPLLAVVASILR